MRFFSSDVAPLGFIGLGNMGGPMARNLLKAGHKVVGFDVSPANLDSFAAAGGQPVESPLAVAALAKTVVTMLPAGSHVLEVYNGQDGLLSDGGAGNGSLLIDCSTCEPAIGKQVAALAGQRGAATVDAPVSGGTPAAEQASLTFMVGGPGVAVKQAELILQHMGKKVIHCGDAGMGQAAKLCNNLVLGITMAGVCEGHALAGRFGLDQKKLAEILNISSGRSWSSELYNPCPGVMEGVPAARGYTGGFACDLIVKDLGLAANAALASKPKLGLPMGGLALQMYSQMSARGDGMKDFSGLYTHVAGEEKKS